MVDEYDKIPAVRRSLLWELKKSPAHYKWAAEGEGIDEETPALRLGTLIHCAVLEFMDYHDRYKVIPTTDRRTKEGKALYQEYMNKLKPGQEPITPDENDMAMQMRAAIVEDPNASKYLTEFRPEQVYVWTDPETGERCKMKADAVTVIDGQDVLIDFKTTDSCADGHFERSVKKYGYQLQAGMYCEGYFANTYRDPKFIFVAQEKKPPYACRVYECDPYFVQQGQEEFHRLLQIYHHCKETDSWPGYAPTQLLGE